MERPQEAVALTDLLATEAFQNAYDGGLPLWGVPSRAGVRGHHDAVWMIGQGQAEPAAARFQVGDVRLDYYGQPGELFEIDRLPVPALDKPVQLGGVVQLVAVQFDQTEMGPGETLDLVLCWRAQATTDASYTVFVQAIDEAGIKAGQVDRPPCDGGCPTSTWHEGDLVVERYGLPIQANAQPGRYQLIAGMYDWATGELLPRLGADGHPSGTPILLGSISVQP
jgi:hypothetical protein